MYSRGPAVLCADPSTAAAHLLWLTSGRVVIQHQGVFMKSAHTHTHTRKVQRMSKHASATGAHSREHCLAQTRGERSPWRFPNAHSEPLIAVCRPQQKGMTVIVHHSSAADGGHVMQAERGVRTKGRFD